MRNPLRFLGPSYRGYSFAERLRRTRDEFAWSAVSFIPKRIRYTTTMREIAKATRTSENVPATPLDEILKNLDAPKSFT